MRSGPCRTPTPLASVLIHVARGGKGEGNARNLQEFAIHWHASEEAMLPAVSPWVKVIGRHMNWMQIH